MSPKPLHHHITGILAETFIPPNPLVTHRLIILCRNQVTEPPCSLINCFLALFDTVTLSLLPTYTAVSADRAYGKCLHPTLPKHNCQHALNHIQCVLSKSSLMDGLSLPQLSVLTHSQNMLTSTTSAKYLSPGRHGPAMILVLFWQ